MCNDGNPVLIHQDTEFCAAQHARLERLYFLDGRDNPDHPHANTYSALARKYNGISTTNTQDLPPS